MAFIKSDTLSTNKVDIENFSFVSVYLISLGYCLGNSSKKRKKRFIIFLQIRKKLNPLKKNLISLKRKIHYCVWKKNFKRKIYKVYLCLDVSDEFFSYTPRRNLCRCEFCFNFRECETCLVTSGHF